MNFRLKALKEMKEDLMIGRSLVPNEFLENEFEFRPQVLYYNYNDIKREILEEPVEVKVPLIKERKRFVDSQFEMQQIEQ